jgi:hypothetical protein
VVESFIDFDYFFRGVASLDAWLIMYCFGYSSLARRGRFLESAGVDVHEFFSLPEADLPHCQSQTFKPQLIVLLIYCGGNIVDLLEAHLLPQPELLALSKDPLRGGLAQSVEMVVVGQPQSGVGVDLEEVKNGDQ